MVDNDLNKIFHAVGALEGQQKLLIETYLPEQNKLIHSILDISKLNSEKITQLEATAKRMEDYIIEKEKDEEINNKQTYHIKSQIFFNILTVVLTALSGFILTRLGMPF